MRCLSVCWRVAVVLDAWCSAREREHGTQDAGEFEGGDGVGMIANRIRRVGE